MSDVGCSAVGCQTSTPKTTVATGGDLIARAKQTVVGFVEGCIANNIFRLMLVLMVLSYTLGLVYTLIKR